MRPSTDGSAAPTVHELGEALRQARPATAESKELGSRSRACRRHVRRTLEQVTEAVDLLQARRTVPRGDDARDWSRRPGVPLSVWLLHVRYARSGSAEDLGALVGEYEQYALSLSRRLRRDREPSDDLDQVARESLVVALQRFDCERGLPFPAFATPTILGALRRHYRDHGWSIRVPRKVHELAVPAREAADRLTTELGRAPTPDEVAQELGIETAELLATQQAAAARTPASLDSTATVDGPSQHEVIGDDDRNLLVAEDQVVLAQAIELLGDRDRDVIRLYFFEELTQSQIAERYGVSQMQVSRWISSIVKRLRSHMEA
jgi:RNA polymerase sigma-B factor